MTVQENTQHGFDVLGRKGNNGGMNKPVAKIDKESNNILKMYNSISEASEDMEITIQAISRCLNGRSKTSKGYKWKFVNEGVTTIESTSKDGSE